MKNYFLEGYIYPICRLLLLKCTSVITKRTTSLLILIQLFCFSYGQSVITVEGAISDDTVWSADTVKVTGDVTVEANKSLTIEPGVYVEFQGKYALNINGALFAKGSAEKIIHFTSVADRRDLHNDSSGWKGIRFIDCVTQDSSVIDYSLIEYVMSVEWGSVQSDLSGAVFVSGYDNLSVSNSTFRRNKAFSGGAICCGWSTRVYLYNNIIENNAAKHHGGGVFVAKYSSAKIVNCLFINNYANLGSAIYCAEHTIVDVVNNTITRGDQYNRQNYSKPSAIYSHNHCNLNVYNSVIWNNRGEGILGDYLANVRVAYSNTQDKLFEGKGNLSVNPQFEGWGHNLQKSSPCINGGFTRLFKPLKAASQFVDINQNSRVYRNDEVAIIDMGAVEFQASSDTIFYLYPSSFKDHYIEHSSVFVYDILYNAFPRKVEFEALELPQGAELEFNRLVWQPTEADRGMDHTVRLAIKHLDSVANINFKIRVLAENEFLKLPDGNVTWDYDTVKVYSNLNVALGDTLTVKPNTYVEMQGHYSINIDGSIHAKGKRDSLITFTAKDRNEGWYGIRFDKNNDGYSEISYSILEYGKIDALWNQPYDGTPIYINQSDNISINNSIIRHSWTNLNRGGALFVRYSNNITISNNLIEHNDAGISGIQTNCELFNNVISNNYDGVYLEGADFGFLNNTIANNVKYAIKTYTGKSSVEMVNSIVWGNNFGKDQFYYDGGSDFLLEFSIISDTLFKKIPGGQDKGNICENPLFVSYSDLSLQKNSPAIDAGLNEILYYMTDKTDRAGNARHLSRSVDIGAYEYAKNFALAANLYSVDESLSEALILDTLEVVNADSPLHFSIIDGNSDDVFALNSTTGELKIVLYDSINFESRSEYLLTVAAASGSLSDTSQFMVSVNDINEPITDIILTEYDIPEKTEMGTFVSYLDVEDDDRHDSHYFEFADGEGDDDNGSFKLWGFALRLNDSLDYIKQSTYSIRVKATDYDDYVFEKILKISVIKDPSTDIGDIYGEKNNLLSVYPNPTVSDISLKYSLNKTQSVDISLLDSKGRYQNTLYRGEKPMGDYHDEYNVDHLENGIYIISIRIGNTIKTQKIIKQ